MSALATALGSVAGVMTLAEHDRVFAFVSHLPQLAVSALMAVAGNAVGADGLALSGRGLLDTTRLASSPADIWRDVAAVNAAQIGPALDALITVLQSVRDDLQGGTFTISNGGVYGSLMSTPILNTPQSGILGMHKIQQRPMAVAGKVEIRPMMYIALSYDHRIVDGKEAVTFLVKVKQAIEDPVRLLLGV